MTLPISNLRPEPDDVLIAIADYVGGGAPDSDEAVETARYCLLDSLGCGFLSLAFPECTKLLGPVVPGAGLAVGSRIPGTAWRLEPVHAAFNIGCMIRWLDFNDTWLAAEWGHPSDNLGGILASMDYLARAEGRSFTVRDLLTAMIRAHEIQGVLALENSFNRVGLDHVLLVRVATVAVVTGLLRLERDSMIHAVSNAWADGGALRTYRHAPNTGSRKSWAAGDATSRGVRLALMARTGEMGYPSVLSADRWGFYDVLFGSRPFTLGRPFGSYVMENILFKISFPAEFHAQTAVECAFALHPQVASRLHQVDLVRIRTHESAIRIIDKMGPLHNPADRDHCLQYMIAVGLIFGELSASHYENDVAGDPRIDALRATMVVEEDADYSRDYLDPDKRSIANALEVTFTDGSSTGWVEVEYPIGHRRRRAEGMPRLMEKFLRAVRGHFPAAQADRIAAACGDPGALDAMPIQDLTDLLQCPETPV